VLGGPAEVPSAMDRVAGYRRAMTEAGLGRSVTAVYYSPFTIEGGYEAARQALAVSPRPTALFAANNFIAIGALRALRDAGLRVRDDVSVVAFDDLPHSMVIEPFLTAVVQPAYEMGRQATLLLLERLAGGGPEAPREILLPTELIIRASSGPPPAK